MLTDFAHGLAAGGVAVAGLVQINGSDASCETMDMELEDLDTGRRINICQDLGSGSAGSCRLDPTGLAEAAGALKAALDKPLDLVVINKFGRMESEGLGLIAEIGEAVAAGRPAARHRRAAPLRRRLGRIRRRHGRQARLPDGGAGRLVGRPRQGCGTGLRHGLIFCFRLFCFSVSYQIDMKILSQMK